VGPVEQADIVSRLVATRAAQEQARKAPVRCSETECIEEPL
jgi:hypothetical protein